MTHNLLAESFVDGYRTKLITDLVWRTRSQLEPATVEWIGWFNHLHESLGDIPPLEFEELHHAAALLRSRPCRSSMWLPADLLIARASAARWLRLG